MDEPRWYGSSWVWENTCCLCGKDHWCELYVGEGPKQLPLFTYCSAHSKHAPWNKGLWP